MKKAILYFVMMWAVAVSYGQNDSSKSAWIFEMSEGFSKAMGYPSISLFDDATESYNSMLSNIFIGRGKAQNSEYYGLSYSHMLGNTIQPYRERYSLSSVMLSAREVVPVGDRFGLWAGLNVGVGLMTNSYVVEEKTIDVDRFLAVYSLNAGISYDITERTYIGMDVSVFGAPLYKHDYEVPVGTTKNYQNNISGFQLKLNIGVRL